MSDSPPTGPDADRPEPLPEHEQEAWDAIVADLRGQIDLGPGFPSEPGSQPAPATAPTPPRELARDFVLDEDLDEGFVPPHPPPIPRPSDAIGRFSWAAALGGPGLVIVATVLSWDRWIANLGVALAIGGFVSLVWRMKERDDEDDDGAVV